jgi:hypothetical protein
MKYCYDNECFNLAIHFFGEKDSRLQEISQAIQDTVECFQDDGQLRGEDASQSAKETAK